AWGNGAYHMEAWGLAALACRKYEVAEEAFLEALAHDSGCFHAALGLQVMCEKLGRSDEAIRYAALAQKAWRKAAQADLVRELDLLGDAVAASGVDLPPSLVPFSQAPAPCKSGPHPGPRPGPYSSVVCTGPNRGTLHCYICETADKPAVIIFARHQTETLGK